MSWPGYYIIIYLLLVVDLPSLVMPSWEVEAFCSLCLGDLLSVLLLRQPGAVSNLPAVASKTQLMDLMNQGTITLAKSCLDLRGGKGIRVFINTHMILGFSRVIKRRKTLYLGAQNGCTVFFFFFFYERTLTKTICIKQYHYMHITELQLSLL